MAKTNDITGQKFGYLTAIKRVPNNKGRQAQWLFKCDCGNEVIKRAEYVKRIKNVSCGCKRGEANKMNAKKYNQYHVWENTVFVKFTNCDEYFLCDLEDWNNLKNIAWYKSSNGYAVNKSGKKALFFHRAVLECPEGFDIDHKYRVSQGVCDNRKKNLRIVTREQNSMNKGLNKNNTSGHKGVILDKRNNKWYSAITAYGKTKFLGYFNTAEEANLAYIEAEIKYFGDYRRTS